MDYVVFGLKVSVSLKLQQKTLITVKSIGS